MNDEMLTILARLIAPSLAAMLSFLLGMYVGRRSTQANHIENFRYRLMAYENGKTTAVALRDAHRRLPQKVRDSLPIDRITKANPDELKRQIELYLEELQ